MKILKYLYQVHVSIDGQPVPTGPISTRVYDPERIVLSDINNAPFPQIIQFTVDASKAGYGNLEIAITDSADRIIPSEVTQDPGAASRFVVSFRPEEPGQFVVHISFNSEPLKGGE